MATRTPRRKLYACAVYPESANIELMWLVLASLHVEVCVSPLHDHDTFTELDVINWDKTHGDPDNPPDERERPVVGALKKPHYHVLFCLPQQQPMSWVREVCEPFAEIRWVEPVHSSQGYKRYLCHLDDPDKWQYEPALVRGFGHADLSPLWNINKDEKRDLYNELMDLANKRHIYSFVDLVDAVRMAGRADLWECVTEKSYFWGQYLQGLLYRDNARRDDVYDVDLLGITDDLRFAARNLQSGELREVA